MIIDQIPARQVWNDRTHDLSPKPCSIEKVTIKNKKQKPYSETAISWTREVEFLLVPYKQLFTYGEKLI